MELALKCVAFLHKWKTVLLAFIGLYVALVILYEYNYKGLWNFWAQVANIHVRDSTEAESDRLREFLQENFNETTKPVTLEILPRITPHRNSSVVRIALALGITSRGVRKLNATNMDSKFLFFKTLLPSFCRTMSRGYAYDFYTAYDFSDKLLSNGAIVQAFEHTFKNITFSLCPPQDDLTRVELHMTRCSHQRKPPWAQNDAMIEAYLDGMEYLYRINDDTIMNSSNWTEIMITTLHNMSPPNVGVVGPFQRGKNYLTYEFVHRTHVDIFGFHYPRYFTEWWADQWLSYAYSPNHCKKLKNVVVRHTMQLGQRYGVNRSKRAHFGDQVNAAKLFLQR